MNAKTATDKASERIERDIMTSECEIKDTSGDIVYSGVCYASRRRQATTPKTDQHSRTITRIVNVKIPRSANYIEEGYFIKLDTGIAEMDSFLYVVKDVAFSSQYQLCKNLIAEASAKAAP